jgi:Uma2 family endonuclease
MTAVAEPVPAVSPPPDVPEVPIWRMSVEQYHRMVDAGILDEDTPVELLEGWLVQKMTKHPAHVLSSRLTAYALERLLPAGWFLNRQDPVTTGDSEPEPDIAVVRGGARDYASRHPGPNEVPLVVEVAEASLKTDRTVKKRAYARAGIAAYWIVNLVDGQLEVYTDPTGPAARPDYRERQVLNPGESIAVVLDGEPCGYIPVAELFP